MSNRKKYVKSTFQVDNMQNVSFQTKFGKKSVANFSKECAFLLPLRKMHCAIISFSGSAEVAAGLSNPPTPWSGVAVDLGKRKVVKSIVNSTI